MDLPSGSREQDSLRKIRHGPVTKVGSGATVGSKRVTEDKEKPMKEEHLFYNPFRMLSPKLNHEALKIEQLHTEPVRESISLQEGLLVMVSKLIEMCRLLAKAFITGSETQMKRCEALAREVHEQEKILTKELVASDAKGELLRAMIRFPYRLERVGDLLESTLNCCRSRATHSIPFSDKALAELDGLFTALLGMMNNLRDSLKVPNKVILEAILSDAKRVNQLFEDSKLAHWRRLEAGFCAVEASSMYRDILDSLKSVSEYLVKMTESLLDLAASETKTQLGDVESAELGRAESNA
jgi:Na+/phosphate symporter